MFRSIKSPCLCSCRVKCMEKNPECLWFVGGSFSPRCVPREMEVPGFGWVLPWLVASAVPGGRAVTSRRGRTWPWLGSGGHQAAVDRASAASYAASVTARHLLPTSLPCVFSDGHLLCRTDRFSPRGRIFPSLFSYHLKGVW